MTMLNKSARRDLTITEDFSNPRVGVKMKLHTNLAKHWRTPIIGGSELMINRMKDSLFLRVMANLFPIVLNGYPVMGQKAHLRIVYFIHVTHSNGLIGIVQLTITLYVSKIHDLTEQNRVLCINKKSFDLANLSQDRPVFLLLLKVVKKPIYN